MLHRHQEGNGILANRIARGSINLDKDGRIFRSHPILNVSSSVRSRPTRIFRSSLIPPLKRTRHFYSVKLSLRFIIVSYTCLFSLLSFPSFLFLTISRMVGSLMIHSLSCFPQVGRIMHVRESYVKRFPRRSSPPSFLIEKHEPLGVYGHLYSEPLGSEIRSRSDGVVRQRACENCPPIANRLTNEIRSL